MYNSRVRYSDSGVKGLGNDFSVPENYSGNAFRDGDADEKEAIGENEEIKTNCEDEVDEKAGDDKKDDAAAYVYSDGSDTYVEDSENERTPKKKEVLKKKSSPLPLGLKLDFGHLFGGSFGFEELLIIGLIFLISQGEGNEDIIALLVLLLFIG